MNETALEQVLVPRTGDPPVICSKAPGFEAHTTASGCSLVNSCGRWLVFFSRPADFTTVFTSEFIVAAKRHLEFRELDRELLALSVDSVPAHMAWAHATRHCFGAAIPFPIVEDPSLAIAAAYGMIQPEAIDAATMRVTFIIDPDSIVRAVVWRPMTTGRSVDELLRLVKALQTSDTERAWTPEGWRPGDDLIEPAPLTVDNHSLPAEYDKSPDWYYRIRRETIQ